MSALTDRQAQTLWHLLLGAEIALLLAEREPGASATAVAQVRLRTEATRHTARLLGCPDLLAPARTTADQFIAHLDTNEGA